MNEWMMEGQKLRDEWIHEKEEIEQINEKCIEKN